VLLKDVFLSGLFFLLVTWLIHSKRIFYRTEINTVLLSGLFTLKVVCALFFLKWINGSFNLYTFDGDSIVYLNEGETLANFAKSNPLEYLQSLFLKMHNSVVFPLNKREVWSAGKPFLISDGRNLIRLNSLLNLITFNSRYTILLIYCLVAFSGVCYFFRALKDNVHLKKEWLFLSLFCIPSVLFWTSSVLKEVPALFLSGILCYSLLGDIKYSKRLKWFVFSLLGILIFKTPLFFCTIPAISWLVILNVTKFNFRRSLVLFSISCISPFCFSTVRNLVTEIISQEQFDFVNTARGGIFFHSNDNQVYCVSDTTQKSIHVFQDSICIEKSTVLWKIPRNHAFSSVEFRMTCETKQTYKIDFRSLRSQSLLSANMIHNNWANLIGSIPTATFNILVRPLWSDPGSDFKYFAFMENMLFLLLFIIAIFSRTTFNDKERSKFYFFLIYGCTIYILLGLAIPVTGALVRYKIIGTICLFICALWKIFKSKKSISL